jgi:hypothetical protein
MDTLICVNGALKVTLKDTSLSSTMDTLICVNGALKVTLKDGCYFTQLLWAM